MSLGSRGVVEEAGQGFVDDGQVAGEDEAVGAGSG
jgi:hypothetical protein